MVKVSEIVGEIKIICLCVVVVISYRRVDNLKLKSRSDFLHRHITLNCWNGDWLNNMKRSWTQFVDTYKISEVCQPIDFVCNMKLTDTITV